MSIVEVHHIFVAIFSALIAYTFFSSGRSVDVSHVDTEALEEAVWAAFLKNLTAEIDSPFCDPQETNLTFEDCLMGKNVFELIFS